MIKRALISVSDQKGYYDFSRKLVSGCRDSFEGEPHILTWPVYRAKHVGRYRIPMIGWRVKTLHPLLHGEYWLFDQIRTMNVSRVRHGRWIDL